MITMKRMADAIFDYDEQFNNVLDPILAPKSAEVQRLTKSQLKLLFRIISRPGLTASELGEAMAMTKANISILLDSLEAEGLVCRKPHDSDRRRMLLELTASGHSFCDQAGKELQQRLDTLFSRLSESDRESFASHLEAATKLLKESAEA